MPEHSLPSRWMFQLGEVPKVINSGLSVASIIGTKYPHLVSITAAASTSTKLKTKHLPGIKAMFAYLSNNLRASPHVACVAGHFVLNSILHVKARCAPHLHQSTYHCHQSHGKSGGHTLPLPHRLYTGFILAPRCNPLTRQRKSRPAPPLPSHFLPEAQD